MSQNAGFVISVRNGRKSMSLVGVCLRFVFHSLGVLLPGRK